MDKVNWLVAGTYYAYGRMDSSGGGPGPRPNPDEFAALFAEIRTSGGHAVSVQDAWANYLRVLASQPTPAPVRADQINHHNED
jgi:hypothetical protein